MRTVRIRMRWPAGHRRWVSVGPLGFWFLLVFWLLVWALWLTVAILMVLLNLAIMGGQGLYHAATGRRSDG